MNKGQEMNEERINIWGFLCREDRMSFFKLTVQDLNF